MKAKKLFISVLAVLATLTCAGAVSCKCSGDEGNPSGTPNVPDGPVEPGDSPELEAYLDIKQESETLYILGEIQLTLITENVVSEVEWTSADESIATVSNDGVVKGLRLGTTTITATADGVSDTCEIVVLRSNEAPVLNVSRKQVSVDKDGEYTVTASLKWLGKDVMDEIELDWALGAGADEGVATVTPLENGTAVIKGVEFGETEIYVSATVAGAYINQKISVTVCDSSVWFESDELEMGNNGKFALDISTVDDSGNALSKNLPAIKAYRDGEEIEDASFTWSSADESIVKIEGDKLIAQRAGTTDIFATYAGNKAIITVFVGRTEFRFDEVVTFEQADLKPVQLDGNITASGKVYLNDLEIGVFENGKITLDETKYPTKSKELGTRELVIKTDEAAYVLTANLYSMYIETAEELDAWHSYAFANDDDGYYVLANNISYNKAYTGSRNWDKSGYSWADADAVGFKGVFDGNGYVISGLRIEEGYRGFVTLLRGEGVIKNVAFTNASCSAYGAYVCAWGCGTIENVYVQYADGADTGYYDKNSVFGGTFMSTNRTPEQTKMTGQMTIRNCFVDASMTSLEHDYQSYIGGYMYLDKSTNPYVWTYDGTYAKINEVYVLGPAKTAMNKPAQLLYNTPAEGSANYALYNTESAMAADSALQAIIAKWDADFWTVKNGIPAPLKLGGVEEVISLSKVQDIDLDLTYNNGLVYSTNNATLDISEVSNIKTVTSVALGGALLENVSYQSGTLTIPKKSFGTAYGEKTMIINATRNDGTALVIKAPVLLITQVITTAAELDAMYNIAEALVADTKAGLPGKSHGYFVLGDDIAYNKAYSAWPTWQNKDGHYKWGSPNNVGFSGTFDGRGYVIDGMNVSSTWGGFITLLQAEGVIKNVAFTNASLTGQLAGFICSWGCGTIENVYVQYAEGSYGAANFAGTFFVADNARGVTNGLTIKNCFIDASAITSVGTTNTATWIGYISDGSSKTNVDETYSYVDLQGVYVLVPATAIDGTTLVVEADGGNEVYAGFSSTTAMAGDTVAQDEIATWNTDYWTIVDGVPTWKTLNNSIGGGGTDEGDTDETTQETITLSTRQDIDLGITSASYILTYSSDNATLEVSGLSGATIQSITLDGIALEGATCENNVLTVPKKSFGNAYGEKMIVITAINGNTEITVNVPVLLITSVITNLSQLRQMYGTAEAIYGDATDKISAGYFVLGGNISYNSECKWPSWEGSSNYAWGSPNNVGFRGTFDGRGYTIDGMTISNNYSAFITLLQKDGVIKNVGFTNAVLAGKASGFVCVWGCGTLENVYVQYAEGTYGVVGGYNGTFFATDNVRNVAVGGGLTIKNCFVDASLITTVGVAQSKGRLIGYVADVDNAYVTLEGVYAIGNKYEGTNAKDYNLGKNVGNANCGWFETSAKMQGSTDAQAELATWDTAYWTIVDGVPTWKN